MSSWTSTCPRGCRSSRGQRTTRSARASIPGQEVDHTWRVSAPAACDDETYKITLNAAFKNASGTTSFTRSRDRDLLVRGTCAHVAGRVTDRNTGVAIAGAYVYFTSCPQACPSPLLTNALGGYAFGGLPAGTYTIMVTGPGAYGAQSRQLTLTAGAHTENFQLSDLHGPPPGTGVTPSNGTNPDGVPIIPGGAPATVTTQGCAGGSGTFTVKRGSHGARVGPADRRPRRHLCVGAVRPVRRRRDDRDGRRVPRRRRHDHHGVQRRLHRSERGGAHDRR